MDNKKTVNIKSLVEGIFKHIESGSVINAFAPKEPEDYSKVYSLACDYYDKGLIVQAEKIFHSLCLYDFTNIDYLLGLAAVNQVKKQYQKAINLYSLAISLDENNFMARFYSGQCYFFMGENESAMNYFLSVVDLELDTEHKAMVQHYINLLEK